MEDSGVEGRRRPQVVLTSRQLLQLCNRDGLQLIIHKAQFYAVKHVMYGHMMAITSPGETAWQESKRRDCFQR